MARHINSLTQVLIRHAVAFMGASFGPELSGRLNVLLWRARARLYSKIVDIPLGQVNYLHIPRTGGTSMKNWIDGVPNSDLVIHDHGTKSFHIKPPMKYIVAYRMPSQRLASALARANSNIKIAEKVATMTKMQSNSIKNFGNLCVPELEDQIRATSWKRRYKAYLTLNCAGELTEPLASFVSKRDLFRNPPSLAFHYEDSNSLSHFLKTELGLQLTDRPWSNKETGERFFEPTPNLSRFYSLDLEVIQILKISSATESGM